MVLAYESCKGRKVFLQQCVGHSYVTGDISMYVGLLGMKVGLLYCAKSTSTYLCTMPLVGLEEPKWYVIEDCQ